MSHSVSSKARADREGGFSFECLDYAGNVFRMRGGFATQSEAIRAAESAERDMVACGGSVWSFDHFSPTDKGMTDDELLAELSA